MGNYISAYFVSVFEFVVCDYPFSIRHFHEFRNWFLWSTELGVFQEDYWSEKAIDDGKMDCRRGTFEMGFCYMCLVVDEQPVTRVCVLCSGRDIAQRGTTLQRKKLEKNRYL